MASPGAERRRALLHRCSNRSSPFSLHDPSAFFGFTKNVSRPCAASALAAIAAATGAAIGTSSSLLARSNSDGSSMLRPMLMRRFCMSFTCTCIICIISRTQVAVHLFKCLFRIEMHCLRSMGSMPRQNAGSSGKMSCTAMSGLKLSPDSKKSDIFTHHSEKGTRLWGCRLTRLKEFTHALLGSSRHAARQTCTRPQPSMTFFVMFDDRVNVSRLVRMLILSFLATS
mmetsp:Transcript_46339/g.76674  ORF Transcript_46339/g.76674 Transcript_46339/m.76674 type:complete len:227 (+) Transcript_46339:1197-1877(+)